MSVVTLSGCRDYYALARADQEAVLEAAPAYAELFDVDTGIISQSLNAVMHVDMQIHRSLTGEELVEFFTDVYGPTWTDPNNTDFHDNLYSLMFQNDSRVDVRYRDMPRTPEAWQKWIDVAESIDGVSVNMGNHVGSTELIVTLPGTLPEQSRGMQTLESFLSPCTLQEAGTSVSHGDEGIIAAPIELTYTRPDGQDHSEECRAVPTELSSWWSAVGTLEDGYSSSFSYQNVRAEVADNSQPNATINVTMADDFVMYGGEVLTRHEYESRDTAVPYYRFFSPPPAVVAQFCTSVAHAYHPDLAGSMSDTAALFCGAYDSGPSDFSGAAFAYRWQVTSGALGELSITHVKLPTAPPSSATSVATVSTSPAQLPPHDTERFGDLRIGEDVPGVR